MSTPAPAQPAELPAQAKASRDNSRLAFAGVIIASLASLVIVMEANTPPGKARREAQAMEQSESADLAQTRRFAEDRLRKHTPSATKFSPTSETVITNNSEHSSLVAGWVDSQNADGVITRQRYTIRVWDGDGGLRADNLKLSPW